MVDNNSKQRFSISSDGQLIRANQGHSVAIDLDLIAKAPPTLLYHGTSQSSQDIINKEGLKKMNRNHVHLSMDVKTALNVGGRHGKPIVFIIDSETMAKDGYAFFQAENGVWLTEAVPKQYMKLKNEK